MAIYAPRQRIVIASSFEGIFNDGARECALVAFNAYMQQEVDLPASRDFILGKVRSAAEFNRVYKDDPFTKAFVALRPLVKVAEDYRTVVDLLFTYLPLARQLAADPKNVGLYSGFERRFNEDKERTQPERDAFGKDRKMSFFYRERERLMEEDMDGWLASQSLYPDTLPQFAALVDTQAWDGDTPASGFYPRFASTKRESDIELLCRFYSHIVNPTETESGRCLIPRDGIVGVETVPSKQKLDQLKVFVERLDVPRSQVWNLNDRYDPEEQQRLYDEGFTYQFFLPGYAAPHEIEQARSDRLVRTLDRQHFAEQLGAFAEQWGF